MNTKLLFFLIHLQEIISEEIVDETDRYEDNQNKKRAKRVTTASIMRGWVLEFLRLVLFKSWPVFWFIYFISIVERERRKDAVSLLWPEPRSPSDNASITPNVHTPLKEGGSGNVYLSGSRQGSWDLVRWSGRSWGELVNTFFLILFSLGHEN